MDDDCRGMRIRLKAQASFTYQRSSPLKDVLHVRFDACIGGQKKDRKVLAREACCSLHVQGVIPFTHRRLVPDASPCKIYCFLSKILRGLHHLGHHKRVRVPRSILDI